MKVETVQEGALLWRRFKREPYHWRETESLAESIPPAFWGFACDPKHEREMGISQDSRNASLRTLVPWL